MKRKYQPRKVKDVIPKFELIEGVPKSRYGLPEIAYQSLVANLSKMKPDKNQIAFPSAYKAAVSKIIKDNHPEYAVKYQTNEGKEICSVWRKA